MSVSGSAVVISFFFFNDTATTEIYTLSLHDALPIFPDLSRPHCQHQGCDAMADPPNSDATSPTARTVKPDRKSTRLNSSHANISYAVFCLKKKIHIPTTT